MVETIVPISARLIANKSGFRFKNAAINLLMEKMAAQLEEKK